jgi:hypothetical protein
VIIVKAPTLALKWLVDALLYGGFLLCFFLNFTGLELHQWLGVSGVALAGYHLATHWSWVKAVSQRFLGKTSGQARLYYLLDAALLLGLAAITVSGLVISTWLELPLSNYATWKDVHVYLSAGTLVLLVAKLVLHWRWIARTAKQQVFGAAKPALGGGALRRAPAAAGLNRREFLALSGVLGLSSAAALANVWDFGTPAAASPVLAQAPQPTATTVPATATATPPSSAAVAKAAQNLAPRGKGAGADRRATQAYAVPGTSAAAPSASQSTTAPSSASSATTASAAQPSPSQSSTETATSPTATSCTVLCDRHCSYPGQCRRYVDANGNRLCDLGECL